MNAIGQRAFGVPSDEQEIGAGREVLTVRSADGHRAAIRESKEVDVCYHECSVTTITNRGSPSYPSASGRRS